MALEEFAQLCVEQIDVVNLLPASFALRHDLTACDALYVVLARAIGCRCLTLDARLAEAAPDCVAMP